ncbi:hypothetical protein [Microbacterium enclense]|uniref:hypothetical protein n=1 Tax=Microbacterium enclense TaxID=993073 RepID=UPI003437CAD3
MAITVSLVGATQPQLAQIVVSATTSGAAWTVTGTAGGSTWTVPGGRGSGDGQQLVLTDNRAPLNVPVTYQFVSTATETASPIVIPQTVGDAVLQSLDGQTAVPVNLQDGTQVQELTPSLALFGIPGRRRPVARYSVTSDVSGEIIARAPITLSPAMDDLLAPGAPVLVRLTGPAMDLPLTSVVGFTVISSTANVVTAVREWRLPFVTLDDPFMDTRLGAFSWDYIDNALAGRTWNQIDTLFAGVTWNGVDQYDWAGV